MYNGSVYCKDTNIIARREFTSCFIHMDLKMKKKKYSRACSYVEGIEVS
jgi:hypothetical protein